MQSFVSYVSYCVSPSMWSGLVGIVSKYEEWGSSGPGRSDMCLVCLSYSIACVQYGMCPVWGVSVWGVSVWGPAVTGCRRTWKKECIIFEQII